MTRIRMAFIAALGALLAVQALGPATYTVDSARIRAGAAVFDLGYTELQLPPFGSISARTHFTPVKLTVGLASVELELLERLAADDGELRIELRRAVRDAGVRFILRHMGLAAVGGAAGALMAGSRDRLGVVAGAAAGLLTVGVLGGATALSFDPSAFGNPRYEGILAAAPWMVDIWSQLLERAGDVAAQLDLLGRNLNLLFGQVDRLSELGRPSRDLAILVISDLHNNALAVELVRRVADTFVVDIIIDGGDLTDFGSAVETGLVAGLAELGVPYVLAPGNHESPESVASLGGRDNVFVLEGETITVRDLTILGVADPGAKSGSPAVDVRGLGLAQAELERALLLEAPTVVVAHNPRVASVAIGTVPVVITGHTHQLQITESKGTVVINPGTSGGAGIRGLTARQEVPYSVVVLYLAKDEDGWRPTAADTIEVYNLRTQFTIERVVFGHGVDRAGGGLP